MREFVVKVTCGSSRGTGFVVARDVILTALHVVAVRERPAPRFLEKPCEVEFARLDEYGKWERKTIAAEVSRDSYSLDDDWVFLQFDAEKLVDWEVQIVDLLDLRDDGGDGRRRWSSWGFPDANPLLGMQIDGHIRTTRAATGTPYSEEAVSAIQLFSDEAAAGNGMPVAGMSGAPVFVDGCAVGFLRYSLLRADSPDKLNSGGTLYATPIERVPVPDRLSFNARTDRLSSYPIPLEPYRFLERYERVDARIFFGRRSEVLQFLSDLRRKDLPPIGLLFGPMGAGKSSFLRAGVEARLGTRKLHVLSRLKEGLFKTWEALRNSVERPNDLLVIDQVDEAWADGNGSEELAALLRDIVQWLRNAPSQPGLRVFLSFREDRLSQVEDGLRLHGIPWHGFQLRHLDQRGLIETMTGLLNDTELKLFYRLSYETPELPNLIVEHVLGGNRGTVAPILQVLLRRLWTRAVERQRSAGGNERVITCADLDAELAAARGLEDFLKRQLEAVRKSLADAVATGLALEILCEYTTTGATARSRSTQELCTDYPKQQSEAIRALISAISEAKLLFREHEGSYRLVHDALAPVIQTQRLQSPLRAQRAYRALANRVADWRDGKTGSVLDRGELRVVRSGLPFVSAIVDGSDTDRLLRASDANARRGDLVRAALFVVFVALAVAATVGLAKWFDARQARERESAESLLRQSAEISVYELTDPAKAAVLQAAAAQVGSIDDARRTAFANSAFQSLMLAPTRTIHIPVQPAKALLSPADNVVITIDDDGAVQAWDLTDGRLLSAPKLPWGFRIKSIAFEPSGRRAAAFASESSFADPDQITTWAVDDTGSAKSRDIDLEHLDLFDSRVYLTPKEGLNKSPRVC